MDNLLRNYVTKIINIKLPKIIQSADKILSVEKDMPVYEFEMFQLYTKLKRYCDMLFDEDLNWDLDISVEFEQQLSSVYDKLDKMKSLSKYY